MHELDWFLCPSSFGATPRPTPAYPCVHSSVFGVYDSYCAALKKGGRNWSSHMAGRPPWSADQGVASLYKSRCTGSSWHSPSPRYTSLGSRSPSLCSLLLLFFSKFIRKRRKIFPFFASPFAFHLHFMFTFYSLQERVCGGTTTLQERFCGASLPARTNLWSVITRKNDFCERQPCPARTTNSRTANVDC